MGRKDAATVEDRVQHTFELLQSGIRNWSIIGKLRERYKISARHAQNYLRRAQDMLIAETGKPATEWRARALGVYETVICDEKATYTEKLRAMDSIVALLGLKIVKVEHSGEVALGLSGANTPLPTKEEAAQLLGELMARLPKAAK